LRGAITHGGDRRKHPWVSKAEGIDLKEVVKEWH